MLITYGQSFIKDANIEVNEKYIVYEYFMHYLNTPVAFGKWLQQNQTKTAKLLDKRKIIINYSAEAPSLAEINLIFSKARVAGIQAPDILFIDGGAHKQFNASICWPFFLTVIKSPNFGVNWFTRDTYFLCLNRRPKYHRIEFINLLLKSSLREKGIISFGADAEIAVYKQWINYIDPNYQKQMPLVVDECNEVTQHALTTKMNSALINVITESTFDLYDFDGVASLLGENTRVFLTEKTTRAFLLKQLPLFLTVTGHVKYLRELGFDMFDDILNHSYDLIINHNDRIRAVFDELTRLCNLPLVDLQTYCSNNANRFEYNAQQCNIVGQREKNRVIQAIANFVK